MPLSRRPLDELTLDDLQLLKDTQAPECDRIDYKEKLPSGGGWDGALADVTSFANARGGYLLYGAQEEKGCPVGFPGIDPSEIENFQNALADKLGRCCDPPLRAPQTKRVSVDGDRVVLVLHILQSFKRPHLVKFNKDGARDGRFYSRDSSGNLVVIEADHLRRLFLLAPTFAQQVRDWRADRLMRIQADETPVSLEPGARIVVHLVPWDAFDLGAGVDFVAMDRKLEQGVDPRLATLVGQRTFGRYNLDGLVVEWAPHEKCPWTDVVPGHWGYAQMFADGCVEIVDTWLLRAPEGQKILPARDVEGAFLKSMPKWEALLHDHGYCRPLVLLVALLSARDFWLFGETKSGTISERARPVDRDAVLLPPLLLEPLVREPEPLANQLRPLFDDLWRAAGRPGCEHFDDDGNYLHDVRG